VVGVVLGSIVTAGAATGEWYRVFDLSTRWQQDGHSGTCSPGDLRCLTAVTGVAHYVEAVSDIANFIMDAQSQYPNDFFPHLSSKAKCLSEASGRGTAPQLVQSAMFLLAKSDYPNDNAASVILSNACNL